MKIQALLFDMDGLLLDTEGIYIRAYAELSKRIGNPREADCFKQFIGKSNRVTCQWVMDELGAPGPVQRLMDLEEELYHEILERDKPKPFAGARELFELCDQRKLKRGLVSSTIGSKVSPTMQVVIAAFKRTGDWQEYFDTICTADRGTKLKPAPDLYELAARDLGLPPQACVAFEDSPVGVQAAHAAGCRVVAIPNLYLTAAEVAQDKAHFVFTTLLDAYGAIDRILN